MDVAKVNRDIAYVAMVVHVFYKGLLPMFHVFLDVYRKCVYLIVAYVLHVCYMYFIRVLRMFANVFKCFRSILQVYVLNV